MALLAALAAHQRLAWIHPFADGNGRVSRLHTHLALLACDVSNGLWSPLRGFARTEARYRSSLAQADEHRRGDLDGRGNLTQAGVVAWIRYALETCADQAQFMARQVDASGMKDRLQAALIFEDTVRKSGVRGESLRPLQLLYSVEQELPRADFKSLTGLGERVATQQISALLREGYLATDSPYGALKFAIPRHALRFLFPALWPEAEADPGLSLTAAPSAATRRRAG